jgi:putative transposase
MNKSIKIYDSDFKKNAVLLSYQGGSIAKVERELKITRSLLNRWREDYQKFGTGSFPGTGYLKLNPKQKRIFELENKIRESNLKFTILKKAGICALQDRFKIFQYIKSNEKMYPIRKMCLVLGVSVRSYHTWKNENISETQRKKILIKKEIITIFFTVKQRYGAARIAIELQKLGYTISSATVGRYMKEEGLYSEIKKKQSKLLSTPN